MESECPATTTNDVTSSSDCSSNENAIVLSLYLIQTEEDILHYRFTKNNHTHKRANLYIRLCEACRIANKILRSAAAATAAASTSSTSTAQQQLPFQSGGDGPIFGVHCDISNDELLRKNDFDADEYWQSQIPGKQCAKDNNEVNSDDEEDDDGDDGCSNVEEKHTLDGTDEDGSAFHQPHLRAIFRYGNDINDMWRCISLILSISIELANANLTCAVECWDVNDGHILLIEAAEHLPSWVDEDVLQGGVGGPEGTVNRCWIVDGQIHLIPPCASNNKHAMSKKKVDLLSRCDALVALLVSFNNDSDGSSTLASEAVQDAIQHRINRTDYSARRNDESPSVTSTNQSSSHWHTAAAALPASAAHFIEKHPSLIPLIIDSFCNNAPKYLKERKLERKRSRNKSTNESSNGSCQETATADEQNMKRDSLGHLFPFEQIVAIPITMTRANFAELVTGRGIVPSFPVPREYRTVELKRFHRQLGQTSYGGLEDEKTNRNPFERAVDVGVRLCTGLEWIVHAAEQKDSLPCPAVEDEDDELLLQSLGDIERRLRLYWTRIDAEASVGNLQHENEETEANHWIEQAWQAGPKDTNHSKCDKLFLSALESMSKCAVFHPELSKSLRDEPCPITRPNMSLRDIARSGIKNALKWQREQYNESHFPTPKLCQLDSDAWMEIESMEELEEEMKHLSSATNKEMDSKPDNKKPRRTTRRSRRNHPSLDNNNISKDGEREASSNTDALNQMAKGFRAFVEGEGDVEGISTIASEEIEPAAESSIENLMSQEVKIRPHVFLGVLRNMLRDECTVPSQTGLDCNSILDSTSLPTPAEPDITSFFFEEDLNYDSDEGTEERLDQMPESHIDSDDDPFSLRNIMDAMDHELRTDIMSDPSIKNLSVATEDSLDDEAMANLLRSMEASEGAGPARTMLRSMGISLPRAS